MQIPHSFPLNKKNLRITSPNSALTLNIYRFGIFFMIFSPLSKHRHDNEPSYAELGVGIRSVCLEFCKQGQAGFSFDMQPLSNDLQDTVGTN